MEKTTVYLTAQQKAALARAAKDQGRSEARLIRAGIEGVLARHAVGESAPVHGTARPERALGLPRWLDRESFLSLVLRHRADPGLREELRALAPGTTDDEPLS